MPVGQGRTSPTPSSSALRPIDGPSPERDVYVLLPPGGRHPLAKPMLEALTDAARALNR